MDPLWQQINQAIHKRDTEAVGQLIPRYLKTHRSSPEAVYEASEFYRKIRDYKNALRVLPKEREASSITRLSDAETRLELQLARLLSLLGASNYALRLVDRIRNQKRAKSKIEMVEIYHCNCKYAEVLEILGADYPLPESEPWHQDWLLHIYLSYALGELKKTDLAIMRMERMRAISASPLIQAIALCFIGKYLMISGEPKKALSSLLESQKFFQKSDRTADHGILQMCLGECLFELKKYSEAERALKIALEIFNQPALKPEDWMEPVLILEQIPGLKKSETHLAPRLHAMYGPEFSPLRLIRDKKPENGPRIFSVEQIHSVRKNRHIDRESDTAWIGKKARLGLDLIDELICNLVYAGEYGLPQFRIYELLWPNEPFSFDQHQKRLEQLVVRARAQGYKISWNELHLRLQSKDVSVSGRPERVIRGYSFLLEHPRFKRTDVDQYFSISDWGGRALCKEWLEAGLVVSEKTSQYRTRIP